jgi:methyltransferase-like protein
MRLHLLFLLRLCLLNIYAFSMEEISEHSVELVELKIDKNKKIKTLDEAYVVANLSPDTWPQYSFSSGCVVDLITQKSCAAYSEQLAQPIKQQIKDLKKNNPDKCAQLTCEIFTELQHRIQNQNKDMLNKLRKEKAQQYIAELTRKKQEIKSLQEWMTYFDKNKENYDAPWSHGGVAVLCILDAAWNVAALVISGILSARCWS